MVHLCVEVSSSVRRCSRTSWQLKDIIPSLQGSREESGRTARTCKTCETPREMETLVRVDTILYCFSQNKTYFLNCIVLTIKEPHFLFHVKINMASNLTNHIQRAGDIKCAEVCLECFVNIFICQPHFSTHIPFILMNIPLFHPPVCQ